MGRPTSANRCGDPHAQHGKILLCGRALAHKGDHGHGPVTWPRRIECPPSNSSGAASPMR
jgi:hypothetical protein